MKKNSSSNPTKRLSIIIVTWNSQDYIEKCITSVIESTRTIVSEIIIVDNNSTDKTCETIKKYKNIILLSQKKNWGFGPANNIGIKHTKGDVLLLLNPDTIVNKHAIESMIQFLHSIPDAGIVGPEQHKDDGKIMFTSTKLIPKAITHYLIEKIINLGRKKERKLFLKPHKTWMVNGGCLLAKRNIFPTHDWFDKKLFVYGEEFDLFAKIKHTKWQVYFLPYCSIVHYRDKSVVQTNKKTLYVLKSFTYLTYKMIKIYVSSFYNLTRKPFL